MMVLSLDESELLVVVNLEDPESIVALYSLLHWPKRAMVEVRVLPFLKAPLNTATDVPKGAPAFEAYKARRASARRRYQDQENVRNLERLGRSGVWEMTDSGALLGHDILIELFLRKASLDRVLEFVSEVLKVTQKIDARVVNQVVGALGLRSDSGFEDHDVLTRSPRLIELSEQLESQGVLSAPSLLFRGEAYLGYGHLPQIESMIASQ